MRFAALLGVAVVVCACESGPAFPGPAGPAVPVALDVQFAHWTLGTWAIDNFDDELTTQLAKYNIQVVPSRARPPLVARVDLGLLGYRQAIDVYLLHDGVTHPAGRVRVPDLAPATLDAAAPLVAAVVARAVLTDRAVAPPAAPGAPAAAPGAPAAPPPPPPPAAVPAGSAPGTVSL